MKSGYASVHGLAMYYEIRGRGRPLVLLHAGFSSIPGSFRPFLARLAQRYKVIAIEQQGHGRTADIDRPMTYEQMAEDTAALLRSLKIGRADFFGWSDGGHVALLLAAHHPRLVRKLAFSGAHPYAVTKFMPPSFLGVLRKTTARLLPPSMEANYRKLAPDPENWADVVLKTRDMGLNYRGLSPAKVRSIRAPTLIMAGDEDVVTVEALADLYRTMRNARLAIIPESGHSWLEEKPKLFLDLLTEFLDRPDERQGGGW